MTRAAAKAFYNKAVSDPETGYITNFDALDSLDVVYDDIEAKTLALTTKTVSTLSLAANASSHTTFPLGNQYRVVKVTTNVPARVRLYVDNASMLADAVREVGTDPADGAGVLLDVVTSADLLAMNLSPLVDGWLATGTDVSATITNLAATSQVVAVTLTAFVGG